MPRVDGPLSLDLVYPPEGARVATDSTFVFGSTGTGAATLRIDGRPVDVAANGAFLAFLPVPRDGRYRLEARIGARRDTLLRRVEVPEDGGRGLLPAPVPARPAEAELRVLEPAGPVLLRSDEPLSVRVRGPDGADVRLVLPDGRVLPVRELREAALEAGFERGGRVERPVYAVDVVFDEDPGPEPVRVELALAGDTARADLPPVELLAPHEVRIGEVATDRPDSTAIGRAAVPPGTPYHWFLPNGTRVAVVGRRGDLYRVQLREGLRIWMEVDDVRLLPGGSAGLRGAAGAIRVRPERGWIDVSVELDEALPFRVDGRAEGGLVLTIYGARSRTNWLYQPTRDPFIGAVWWEQPSDDEYRVHVETAAPLWGWRVFRDDAGRLVLRVRRPPPIDPHDPLVGLTVAVDAGHGDTTGAIGPTRLREGLANRRIAERLAARLRLAGARVFETRPGAEDVPLGLRPAMAEEAGAHLLVSVHNNAFPDGVDPFARAGTSVLYNRPQALDLARAVQRSLLAELELRDLGVIWADLALARPTWMPSVLTETMFLMVPVQEAALRDPELHDRIAEAHVRGIEAFLRRRAGRRWNGS